MGHEVGLTPRLSTSPAGELCTNGHRLSRDRARRLDFGAALGKNGRFTGPLRDASVASPSHELLNRRGASRPTVVDNIEKLKQDFTDKYVVVDAARPELKRFEGHVGQVKTVNMSGRALVQFDAWNNIGWYDIGLDFLKVVPKPAESVADKKKEAPKPVKAAAKPSAAEASATASGEKKLSPLEMARMQGAAKKSAAPSAEAGAKKSTADILAAARANKSAAPAATKPTPAGDQPKMSTADILAAARAKKAGEAAPAAEAAAVATESAADDGSAAEESPAPVEAPQAAAAQAAPAAFPPGERPTVPQILDWCRQHDAK